ncbi:HIT-like protein [Fomitopsis serialis]|uniref:HIT-like protein n=1 Tax=Fomitopsis serialis TaxID=139415 RepID=UPI002007C907|nr:HIT-like protein [Neoantrodia serialis]KAH9930060.1 HIT-like protein [Neoantrodia serialis]
MRLLKSLFASCLGGSEDPRGVTSPTETQHDSSRCKFCSASPENGFDVVWEDESFTVFTDRDPAAAHHFLVIPKIHIDNVKSLTAKDAPMVSRMSEIGHRVLDDLKVPTTSQRLGFHIPPFFSVNHLHMHAQGLPYCSTARALKYRVSAGSGAHGKGFSWFCEADQAVRILAKGGQIAVFPC